MKYLVVMIVAIVAFNVGLAVYLYQDNKKLEKRIGGEQ